MYSLRTFTYNVKNKAPLNSLWIHTTAQKKISYTSFGILVDSGDGGSEASKVDDKVSKGE